LCKFLFIKGGLIVVGEVLPGSHDFELILSKFGKIDCPLSIDVSRFRAVYFLSIFRIASSQFVHVFSSAQKILILDKFYELIFSGCVYFQWLICKIA